METKTIEKPNTEVINKEPIQENYINTLEDTIEAFEGAQLLQHFPIRSATWTDVNGARSVPMPVPDFVTLNLCRFYDADQDEYTVPGLKQISGCIEYADIISYVAHTTSGNGDYFHLAWHKSEDGKPVTHGLMAYVTIVNKHTKPLDRKVEMLDKLIKFLKSFQTRPEHEKPPMFLEHAEAKMAEYHKTGNITVTEIDA